MQAPLQAFQAAPLDPRTAHTALPLQLTAPESKESPKKPRKRAREEVLLTVPDVARVLRDIKTIGVGLVLDERIRYAGLP